MDKGVGDDEDNGVDGDDDFFAGKYDVEIDSRPKFDFLVIDLVLTISNWTLTIGFGTISVSNWGKINHCVGKMKRWKLLIEKANIYLGAGFHESSVVEIVVDGIDVVTKSSVELIVLLVVVWIVVIGIEVDALNSGA